MSRSAVRWGRTWGTSVLLTSLWLGSLAACAPSLSHPSEPAPAKLEDQVLINLDGNAHRVGDLLTRNPWTVFIFFSATCPTVTAHDGRLTELWQDVQHHAFSWFMVASEVDTSLASLTPQQAVRGYPFPLLWDQNGGLARLLDARYASQVFILHDDATVAYAGSMDSDRRFLHPDAEPYLRNALVALIEGRTPVPARKTAYGCALRLER